MCAVVEPSRSIRQCGSCAMNMVGVAAGRLDAMFEIGFGGVWDMAAGAALLFLQLFIWLADSLSKRRRKNAAFHLFLPRGAFVLDKYLLLALSKSCFPCCCPGFTQSLNN